MLFPCVIAWEKVQRSHSWLCDTARIGIWIWLTQDQPLIFAVHMWAPKWYDLKISGMVLLAGIPFHCPISILPLSVIMETLIFSWLYFPASLEAMCDHSLKFSTIEYKWKFHKTTSGILPKKTTSMYPFLFKNLPADRNVVLRCSSSYLGPCRWGPHYKHGETEN